MDEAESTQNKLEPGPQHRDPMATRFGSSYPFPCHFHCDYQIEDQSVHIDFIADLSCGPAIGVYEYRFYIDGTLRSRGGCKVQTFTGASYGKPPAIQVGDHLLIANRNLQGETPPIHDAFSLWICEKPFTPRPNRFVGRFADSSTDDIVGSLNHQATVEGAVGARIEWITELISELERRGIDCSQYRRGEKLEGTRWAVQGNRLVRSD